MAVFLQMEYIGSMFSQAGMDGDDLLRGLKPGAGVEPQEAPCGDGGGLPLLLGGRGFSRG